ncbi:MAG: ATP-binding protein [Flavobacteriales bacterium]|nr:ATP-binding protein [Flavobacteriales bacterium]
MEKKIVITGAPGTGKTAIIDCLKKLGYSCSKEISREIIAEQLASGGDILPWKNLQAFSERVAALRKVQFDNAPNNKIHFFDRGIVDVIAYMRIDNLEIDNYLIKKCKEMKYSKSVFYTPIWEEIYIKDKERKEDIFQAKLIEKELITAYKEFDYNLIEIPKSNIKERVKFILSKR